MRHFILIILFLCNLNLFSQEVNWCDSLWYNVTFNELTNGYYNIDISGEYSPYLIYDYDIVGFTFYVTTDDGLTTSPIWGGDPFFTTIENVNSNSVVNICYEAIIYDTYFDNNFDLVYDEAISCFTGDNKICEQWIHNGYEWVENGTTNVTEIDYNSYYIDNNYYYDIMGRQYTNLYQIPINSIYIYKGKKYLRSE